MINLIAMLMILAIFSVFFGFIFELGKNALTIETRQTSFNHGDKSTPRAFSSNILKSAVGKHWIKPCSTLFKISLVLLALFFFPFFLEWNILIFVILTGIMAGAIYIVVIQFNELYLTGSNYSSILGLHIGEY